MDPDGDVDMGIELYKKDSAGNMRLVRNMKHFTAPNAPIQSKEFYCLGYYTSQQWNNFPPTPDGITDSFPYQLVVYISGVYQKYILYVSTTPAYIDSNMWLWAKAAGAWRSYYLINGVWQPASEYAGIEYYSAGDKMFETYHGPTNQYHEGNYNLFMTDETTIYLAKTTTDIQDRKTPYKRKINI